MDYVTQALNWMADHKAFMAAVGWPVLTGIVNFALKPRSPEEYAAMNPYLRAVLKFTSGAGFDPVKTVKGAQEALDGYAESRHNGEAK